jgi:uncharacterized tellurite resistance protein B-like protein
MGDWLAKLRVLVAPPGSGPASTGAIQAATDEKIALGVLLWSVAEADGRFDDAEVTLISEVLTRHGGVDPADLALVLEAVRQAAKARIDLYSFAREAADGLSPPQRVEIVRQLYRVACADGSLRGEEVEAVRLVATLLRVPHPDFIAAKLAAKAEFALDRDR